MKLSECYVGLKFKKLTIRKIVKEDYWVCYCDCDCGTKNKRILMSNIREGHTTSCGCNKSIKTPNWDINDIKEQIYELYGDEYEVLDEKYINARTPMKFRHKQCGEVLITPLDHMKDNKHTHCKFCLGLVIREGINDLWTLRPDVASMLQDKEIGHKYGVNNRYKTNFVCPNCSHVNYKSIATVTKNGLSCDNCSDNISYPNKFIYYLLKGIGESFEREKKFDWCANKPFDAYIKNKNLIIEMDGGLGHGNRSFGSNWRNPEYGNDVYKDNKAKEHNLKVIRIDCDYQHHDRFDYIKNNILNSELSQIYDLTHVNWNEIDINAQSNTFLLIVNDLKSGMYICDIADKYNLHRDTIGRYLKRAIKTGLYTDEYKKKIIYNHNKSVDMFNKANEKINSFKTMTDAAKYIGVSVSAISNCCKGKAKTAGGYIWRYAGE